MERAVEHRLRVEGAAAWLPLEMFRKANRQSVIRPIFNRYLFVQAYPQIVIRNAGGEEMAQVLVSKLTGRPLILPAAEMDRLLIQCAPNGVIYPPEPREVTHDDAVRVLDGPLADFSGIVKRTTRDRVWIMLGKLGEASFAREQVELIS